MHLPRTEKNNDGRDIENFPLFKWSFIIPINYRNDAMGLRFNLGYN